MNLHEIRDAYPVFQQPRTPSTPYFTYDKVTTVALCVFAAAVMVCAGGAGIVALQVTYQISWWLVLGGAAQINVGIWLGLASSWLYDGADELPGGLMRPNAFSPWGMGGMGGIGGYLGLGGYQNLGNTCFINAVMRAICNDQEMKAAFEDICNIEIRRHKDALDFLPTEGTLIVLARTTYDFKDYPIINDYVKKRKRHQSPTFTDINIVALAAELERLNPAAASVAASVQGAPALTPVPPSPNAAAASTSDPECLSPTVALVAPSAQGAPALAPAPTPTSRLEYHLSHVRNRLEGYEAFLKFLSTGEASMKVRYLLGNNLYASQEDGEELLRAVVKDVNLEDYSDLCFEQQDQRQWEKCSAEIQDREENKLERTQRLLMPNETSELPDSMITSRNAHFEFNMNLPVEERRTGQELLDKYITWSDAISDDVTLWLRNTKGDIDLYRMKKERIHLPQLPKRLTICLKRYAFNASDQTQRKLDYDIPMGEEIVVQGQKYLLRSVVIHSGWAGGGHYTTVMREADTWKMANDGSKRDAAAHEKETALKKGYIYFYEKAPTEATPVVSAPAAPAVVSTVQE